MLQEKLQHKQKKCSICKKEVPVSGMMGTRCMDCFVKKACMPIVYGKEPWEKKLQPGVIKRAVDYLKGLISDPR